MIGQARRPSTLTGTARLAALLASQSVRGVLARLYLARLYRWRFRGPAAEKLLIAPQDLRTSDPTVAVEIYSGRFAFAGKTVSAAGVSPFEIAPPSQAWAEALHDFGWLRHLRASDRALSRANARALVLDWMGSSRRWRAIAWSPPVVSRRVLSWISHSPIILEGTDYAFYRRFMKSLCQQVRYLRRAAQDTEDGYPRLLAAIALTQASLCMADQARMLGRSTRWLEAELGAQVLPDGGHVSRHPGVLIELLLDLLPLRQAFMARDLTPPPALLNAIDRMMPMLRFFRLGEGSFAHFNGMGATPTDALATVLAHDATAGHPVRNAAHSGYQRLDAGKSVVLVDAGRPPPPALSVQAHAGCLSFEFASGQDWLVVNCGAPLLGGDEWRSIARATAAHSTLALNDTSSCRFVSAGALVRVLGTPIIAGPSRVGVERQESPDEIALDLNHDGYEPTFGLVHRRRLALTADGHALSGEDRVEGRPSRADAFAIRFHLHPGVQAEESGPLVTLALPGGERWVFGAELDPSLEESVFLAGREGPRRTVQIVLQGRAAETPRVGWSFRRVE